MAREFWQKCYVAEESPRPIDQLPWRTTEWAGHIVINLIQWLRVIRARGRGEIGS